MVPALTPGAPAGPAEPVLPVEPGAPAWPTSPLSPLQPAAAKIAAQISPMIRVPCFMACLRWEIGNAHLQESCRSPARSHHPHFTVRERETKHLRTQIRVRPTGRAKNYLLDSTALSVEVLHVQGGRVDVVEAAGVDRDHGSGGPLAAREG